MADASFFFFRAADDVLVKSMTARSRGQKAAANMGIGADDGGQAGDEPRGHRTVAVARLAAAQADKRRAGAAESLGKCFDFIRGHFGNRRHISWRIAGQDSVTQFFPAHNVLLDKRFVDMIIAV